MENEVNCKAIRKRVRMILYFCGNNAQQYILDNHSAPNISATAILPVTAVWQYSILFHDTPAIFHDAVFTPFMMLLFYLSKSDMHWCIKMR